MQPTQPFQPTNQFDDVTIIMVTFNSAHVLQSTLSTLAALKHVIIVDNASADHTNIADALYFEPTFMRLP